MSEFIGCTKVSTGPRRALLGTVSSLSLLGLAISTGLAQADEGQHPTVWIELGGQLERQSGGQQPYAPPFSTGIVAPLFTEPFSIQREPRYSNGVEGRLEFAPNDSNWSFAAAVRYGRSNRTARRHEETSQQFKVRAFGGTITATPSLGYSDIRTKQSETHAVIDFQAGKDVGLGLFGTRGSSVINLGIRIAQISSKSNTALGAVPDVYVPSSIKYTVHHNRLDGYGAISRSFNGVGPSLSWDGAAHLTGHEEAGGISFEWGALASILFGRQKVAGHRETSGLYYKTNLIKGLQGLYSQYHSQGNISRSRSVVVPNVQGFAAISVHYDNAKLSVGYRGDIYFNAIEGGIDTRETRNRSFYGPFATISLGLGG